MNKSIKFFIGSLIILACAIGFFLGSLYANNPCHRLPLTEKYPPSIEQKKDVPPPKKKPFKGIKPEVMDSILQITEEQKRALDENRKLMDASFGKMREQKQIAEKELRDALDSGDNQKIEDAKNKILEAQKNLLDLRIEGVQNLNKILSKEQFEKMKHFHNKFRHEKGPKHHKGPRPEKGHTPERDFQEN